MIAKTRSYKNFTIDNYSQVESTNSLIFELAKTNSINHNHIILSQTQSKGRGRYGRDWQSPPGNLYFSLLLKPNKDIAHTSLLSFVGVVAMGLAIEQLAENKNANISYKWPNDILLNNKKVAGLLLESDISKQNKINFVTIGIGVNIISNPNNTIYSATNLKSESINNINPKTLLTTFLDKFTNLYQKWLDFGFLAIRNLWLQKAHNLNKEITVNLPTQQLKGIFQNLDENGRLALKLKNKELKLITSGEVYNY